MSIFKVISYSVVPEWQRHVEELLKSKNICFAIGVEFVLNRLNTDYFKLSSIQHAHDDQRGHSKTELPEEYLRYFNVVERASEVLSGVQDKSQEEILGFLESNWSLNGCLLVLTLKEADKETRHAISMRSRADGKIGLYDPSAISRSIAAPLQICDSKAHLCQALMRKLDVFRQTYSITEIQYLTYTPAS